MFVGYTIIRCLPNDMLFGSASPTCCCDHTKSSVSPMCHFNGNQSINQSIMLKVISAKNLKKLASLKVTPKPRPLKRCQPTQCQSSENSK